MDGLKGLEAYLLRLERETGWEVVIDDFYGHLRRDAQFRDIYLSFGIHKNPYCMKIKENPALWDRCLEGKIPLLEACQREGEIFQGCCFCGREEFILPIMMEGKVVGALSVGGFSLNEEKAREKLRRAADKYALSRKQLNKLRQTAAPLPPPSSRKIEELLLLVTEYISFYYQTMNVPRGKPIPQGSQSQRQYILAHAVEYIRQQYRENISARDVADFCRISESYINHNFKQYMGESLRSYMNKLRIEYAARELAATDKSITRIAMDSGYGDANYFSRVFSREKGCSPRDFRRAMNKG